MPHPIVHEHPYLHLFPDLETKVRKQSRGWEEDIEYSPYRNHRFEDISAKRNGLVYFIYNPWFEPVFAQSDGSRKTEVNEYWTSGPFDYEYGGAGPYWFGNNSVRGVLAETVAELLEEAKLPSAEKAQAPWFGKNHRGRTDLTVTEMRKWTMEEFISTSISYDREEGGWSCYGLHREKCKIIEYYHVTPQVEWEILHPQLPILKITVHTYQNPPLAPAGLEKILREDEKIPNKPTVYSISFVISLQNRWASFDDQNRWIIRFKDDLEMYLQPWMLDPELPYPNYWDDTDYMQHRIIGPVVLTVHSSAVLQPGNYSQVPSIAHWEAPGHILTDEQKRTITVGYHDGPALRVWPDLRTPNAGFPLPGHVLTGPNQGPGTEAWEKYGMEGYDW